MLTRRCSTVPLRSTRQFVSSAFSESLREVFRKCAAYKLRLNLTLERYSLREYAYAIEKLTDAISCLATHPGDARERVVAAFYHLVRLQEKDFPEALRPKWASLMEKIKRKGPLRMYDGTVYLGSVQNTMKGYKNKTASKICNEIFEMYWAVSKNQQYF